MLRFLALFIVKIIIELYKHKFCVEEKMRKIINQFKYWSQLLIIPVYWLSYLIPRDKKTWVFGSTFGRRFADNPKYFYLYVNQMKSDEVRAIWITKNKEVYYELSSNGYEVYLLKSVKGFFYSLRAGVYFYDNYSKDICFSLSGGAKKINLWHGIPLKKIQMDNKFDKVRHPENLLRKLYWFPRRYTDEKPSHFVLTTSAKLIPIFSSAFGTQNVIVSNYPRNDNLIQYKYNCIYSNDETEVLEKMKKNNWSKIILYMPTFRNTEKKFFDIVNIKRLKNYLKDNNILLCIKLHPKSLLNDLFQQLNSEYVIVVDASADPYIILGKVDVLITDYSSIYFDFLLTDKPIIFFDYDREDYLKDSRELYQDYNGYTPGRKVNTMEGLLDAINYIEKDGEEWKNERERIRNEVFENLEENGSEHLYHIVINNVLNKK